MISQSLLQQWFDTLDHAQLLRNWKPVGDVMDQMIARLAQPEPTVDGWPLCSGLPQPEPHPPKAIDRLIEIHTSMLESNPYCYFELAYTRNTGWMAWICSSHRDDNPYRKVIAQGHGDTPEQACASAIKAAHGIKEAI